MGYLTIIRWTDFFFGWTIAMNFLQWTRTGDWPYFLMGVDGDATSQRSEIWIDLGVKNTSRFTKKAPPVKPWWI